MAEKYWSLNHCELFERLTKEQIKRLEETSKVRPFKRGELIYLPTDAGNSVLMVASGRIKIYHITSEGKQAVLSLMEPGEIFGELAALDDNPREEFAEAMVSSSVIMIPSEALRQLAEEHASVSLGVTKLLGLRRRRIERRLKSLLFRSNRDRLIHLLLELTEKYGRQTADGVLITIKLAHQDLASIIGSTRETVTVLLGELQNERQIEVHSRQLLLRNIEKLAHSIDVPVPRVRYEEDLGNRLLRESRGGA
ncbi:Global nitrogen regulator [Polystyrenella longa]|uniref:Global nitrogen regulator n=1 Tax=Polystyrenella longa TaxID=2528007 RepID=A0A518CH02_9PLAN|nr:Crp/Fnr family transcriptional regulator [Polystyrenella longa]QDU78500.1 Global nitrogen regulator [Polystyrenella longa]